MGDFGEFGVIFWVKTLWPFKDKVFFNRGYETCLLGLGEDPSEAENCLGSALFSKLNDQTAVYVTCLEATIRSDFPKHRKKNLQIPSG